MRRITHKIITVMKAVCSVMQDSPEAFRFVCRTLQALIVVNTEVQPQIISANSRTPGARCDAMSVPGPF
jgi:hypothetical protein